MQARNAVLCIEEESSPAGGQRSPAQQGEEWGCEGQRLGGSVRCKEACFSLEHGHCVSVPCVVLRTYPELVGPHGGCDYLAEEVIEKGGKGGGALVNV